METYPFMRHLNGQVTTLVDATLCAKVPHPALAWGIWSSKNVPMLNKWECAKGNCNECGVKSLKLGEYTDLMANSDEIEVLEWIEAERPREKMKHKTLNLN